jgi:hypothetical protein
MKGLGTLAAIALVTLAVAPAAPAQEQTRDGYRERVESICERDTQRGQRILKGAKERIQRGKLAPAGRQFLRVSRTFGASVRQIAKVPRPPADAPRLRKWLKFLRIVRFRLQRLGKTLTEGKEVKSTHASIQLERSGNAANNVGFVFEFRHCRLTRSRFG